MSRTSSICVTGGAGYIGSHTCMEIAGHGMAPLVIDNLSTGSRENVNWGPMINLDLRDTEALTRALIDHSIQTVLHFAASAYVGESVTDPLKYNDNNVGGMLSLLAACTNAGVKTFVLSSSCATYGIPDHVPVDEFATQRPINPYGTSKLMCEHMLKDVALQSGMSIGILRYFNVAGADPSGVLRERHDPETHIIPLALLAAARRTPPLHIFGDDYDTPDGSCIRDYVHVSDLAHGHMLALEYLQQNGGALAVNLGGGRGTSVFDIIAMVEHITGYDVPVQIAPRRLGDPPKLVADTTLARTRLGFKPQRSDLNQIVSDAARSFGLDGPNALTA